MYEFENENCETVFTTALQQKLKTKIVGKIFVRYVSTDSIYVQIRTEDDLEYKTYLNDFTKRVLNGWSADYAAYEVLVEYRKFIMEKVTKKYFY